MTFKQNLAALSLFVALVGMPCDGRGVDDSGRKPSAKTEIATFTRGLPSLEAIAFSPQGVPFAALSDMSGRVVRLPAANRPTWLAETGGQPAGLAFDQAGDLYVADRQRGTIYKVTPWGATTSVAEWLGSPQGVAVGPSQQLYFTDVAKGCVFRLQAGEKPAVVATGIPGARAIAVSMRTGDVYVSGNDRKIWRLSPGPGNERSEFASLADAGNAGDLELDEQGNLYVARDGGGKVSVLSPEGKLIDSYDVPGPAVKSIAFGGLDLATLYVAEAQQGAIYKIRVPHRVQRQAWESNRQLEITEPANGDILNRHDGTVTAGGLRIIVKGRCLGSATVRVNGQEVPVQDGRFQSELLLRERTTRIAAESAGGHRDEITVLWDRHSFPRYRVSTDDNIMFLKDIAEHAETYTSIFDNPYLAFWREMNRKYGAKVHHNIYYETSGFNLSQMPDKFRAEWQQNSNWIRLTLHARSNEPDRPYMHASAQKILEDYRNVTREVERFAGKQLLSRFTTVHWGETTLAAARALRLEGNVGLVGYFRISGDLPSVSYYLPRAEMRHLMGRDYWKDTKEDILFVRHDIIINTVKLDDIVPYLTKIVADVHQSEVMELMVHEQYFYPEYRAYEPDFRQRVERSIEFVSKRGYKPVFYDEGFLGAPER